MAATVQGKVANLVADRAWRQTVVMLVEDGSATPIAIASVCLDGHPQRDGFTNAYTRRIGSSPYVNLIARDERFRGRVLGDGHTRPGAAVLRALLELVQRERPTARGQLPSVFAFVEPGNEASLRTFERLAFRPQAVKHQRWLSDGHGRFVPVKRDITVARPVGKPLPLAPDAGVYQPLLGDLGARSAA